MDWNRFIDIYCERTGPGFLDEPVNAVTNIAFVLAAIALAARLQRAGGAGRDTALVGLTVLVAIIGVGSALFHSFATRWAQLADVIPISLFIYGYFLYAMRRYLSLGWLAATAATLAFLIAAFSFAAALPRGFLNGSGGYLPALAAMLVIAVVLRGRRHGASAGLFAAAAVFALSVMLRSIDQAVCPAFPLGTHFAWHILNAGVLYMLVATAIACSGRRHAGANAHP